MLPPTSVISTVVLVAPPSPHSLFLKDEQGVWETSPGSTGFLSSLSAAPLLSPQQQAGKVWPFLPLS